MVDIEKNKAPSRPVAARDLADFHFRWSEFRPHALAILQIDGLTPDQSETLAWMIELADRVGEKDY